jgi:CheY-like chemotaxis protein
LGVYYTLTGLHIADNFQVENRKILVVDDEAPYRDMLERAFSRIGVSVCSVATGEEALEVLTREYIPVMFLDLGLETLNGLDLCEQIREDSPYAIIYALTGYTKLFGQQEILEAGFNDSFAKPFRLETLYQAVREAFEKIDQLAKSHNPVVRL